MANRLVTDQQLAQLDTLIGNGGTIPSDVNAHLGEAVSKLDAGDDNGCQAEILAGSADNDRNGHVYAWLQKWHDTVEASPPVEAGGTVPTPPPVTPPPAGPPVGSVAPFPVSSVSGGRITGTNLHQGVIYTYAGSGKNRCSWSISSGGYPCYMSFDQNNMGGGHTGGTPWIESPAGAWTVYVRYDADAGRVQDAYLDIYPV